MEQIIRPKGQFVVPLPEGTKVILRKGQELDLYEKLSPEQQNRYNAWMETFTGTAGVVTPVSFDNCLDQGRITIVDGQITGSLDWTTYPFKALREELSLDLRFTNQPLLVSVKGGDISEEMFACHEVFEEGNPHVPYRVPRIRYRVLTDRRKETLVHHLVFGKIDPDTRYWVLVKRRKDGLITVPGKLLNGAHAASDDPLAENRIASLSETGIDPSTVEESNGYVSFERYKRPGGHLVHLGDVNFVSAGACSLTVPEVISGFGEDPHTESLVFVAQNSVAMVRLCAPDLNIWPNLLPLLLKDLKQ